VIAELRAEQAVHGEGSGMLSSVSIHLERQHEIRK